jgi:hypothetical protein
MVLCDCLVTDTGIFVNLFGLREFLFRYDFVAYKRFHTLVFFFGNLVGYPGFLHRVSVGHVFG